MVISNNTSASISEPSRIRCGTIMSRLSKIVFSTIVMYCLMPCDGPQLVGRTDVEAGCPARPIKVAFGAHRPGSIRPIDI